MSLKDRFGIDIETEAQLAILNETIIRLSPDAFEALGDIINSPPSPASAKVKERLARKAPWVKS